MKDEAATILPCVAFAVSALLAFRVVVIYNIKLSRAIDRLRRVYAKIGRDWSYMTDYSFRWRLFRCPVTIRESSDLPEIREAKESLIACSSEMTSTIWKAAKVMLWGLAATILLGVVEAGIRHFR